MFEHAFRQCERYELIDVSGLNCGAKRCDCTGSGGIEPLQAAAQMIDVGFGGDGENNNDSQTQEFTF